MKALGDVLGAIVQRIRDERLLWLLGVLIIAVIAGFRDWIIFVAVLAVGLLFIILNLVIQKKSSLPLAISFKNKESVDIQLSSCKYELRDSQNILKKNGEIAFSLEVNSWVCYLPREIKPEDIIRLFLTERDGTLWETGPFRPLFGNKEAEQQS